MGGLDDLEGLMLDMGGKKRLLPQFSWINLIPWWESLARNMESWAAFLSLKLFM